MPCSTGTLASAVNIQAYLLEGLARWNEDRAASAVTGTSSGLQTYCGSLVHALNDLSQKTLGLKLVPDFKHPSKYTGIF